MADTQQGDEAKSDPLALLLSGAAAVLWALVVYGLLQKVPEYQMAFVGREDLVPPVARWLVAMSEPWIVLLFTVGIFVLILGSFHYKNRPLGLVMVILGAASVYGALTTLEEAKELAAAGSPEPGPRRTTLSPDMLEKKVNNSPAPLAPQPAPQKAPVAAPPERPQTPPAQAQAPAPTPPVTQEKPTQPAPPPPPMLSRPKDQK
jgi:hypothetical protein